VQGRRRRRGRPVQDLVAVDDPIQLAGGRVHHQPMHRDFGADQRAAPHKIHAANDVLLFAGKNAEIIGQVLGQQMPLNSQRLETVNQLADRRLPHFAVGMADDGDLASALDRASQGDGAHGAAQRAGDDVAGVAQPDEMLFRQAEDAGEEAVQARVNAGQRDDGQFVGEIGDADAGAVVTGNRAMIGIENGIEESHVQCGLRRQCL